MKGDGAIEKIDFARTHRYCTTTEHFVYIFSTVTRTGYPDRKLVKKLNGITE